MSSHIVNMHEAKTRLSELVARALDGEEIVIARANTPLVRLTPIAPPARERELGRFRSQIHVAEDFDKPLPDSFWLGESS